MDIKGRVQSLDILRGADLFFLGIAGPLLRCYAQCSDGNLPQSVLHQLNHVRWEGFACWDIIMPLFMFMAGISMPFSLSKYHTNKEFYTRLVRRIVLLFFWGAIVQGNLLTLNFKYIHWFSNTLQSIAVGYLVTALLLRLNLATKWLCATAAVLLGIFAGLLICGGDFTPEGNFCEKIERIVMGHWRDGVWYDENGSWHFSDNYFYTWIVSSLGFAATVLTGAIAGRIIKHGKNKKNIILTLSLAGMALTATGLLWSAQWIPFRVPIIKTIWTPSMVLFTSGICFLLMSLFYFLTDFLHGDRYLGWLKIFGMNSIAAYIMFELTHGWFNEMFDHVLFGFAQFTGAYYPLLLNTATCLFFSLALAFMYKRKIFLKV